MPSESFDCRTRTRAGVLALVILLVPTAPLRATSRSWIAGTGSASTAGNWSPAAIPGSADDLLFQRTVNFGVTFNSAVPQVNSHAYRSTNQVTLTITSPHTVTTTIEVGTFSGDNAAAIVDSGSLNCNGNITLGVNSGATGTLNVVGSSADVHALGAAADVVVGASGVGNCTISGAGRLDAGDDILIASGTNSTGTVTVTGGTGAFPSLSLSTIQTTSATTGDIVVGNSGSGTLNLTSGGLASSAHDVKLAPSSLATAVVNLSGSFNIFGSRLAAANNIDIARNDNVTAAGTATVNVTSPAVVSATNQLRIGDSNGGTGTLTMNSGAVTCGSLVCNQTGHAALNFNDGTLTVNGGTLTPPSNNLTLNGAAAGDNPTLRLTNGATGSLNQLMVAINRQATCEIQSGSALTATGGNQYVGFASGSNGTLRVTGANSLFDATGDSIDVATTGTGLLDIQNGGQVASQTGVVARNAGSNGTATINGANSRWDIAGQLFLGGDGVANGGTGRVNVTAGGTLTAVGSTRIRTPGTISIDAGRFDAAANVLVNGTLALTNGGLVNGPVTVSGGTISGAGTINGDFFVASAATATISATGTGLHIGNDADTDPIHNSGTMNVSGTLVLHDANTAATGDIVLNGGTLSGTHGLTTAASDIISGTGTINGDVFNSGAIQPTGAGGITFNGTLRNTTNNIVGTRINFGPGGGYEGSGVCQADIAGATTSFITATGTLSIGGNSNVGFNFPGRLDVGGNIVTLVDANGAVLANGAVTTINHGRLQSSPGIGISLGATITGDGLFVADITNAGLLDPHSTNPASGGLFTIQGNLQCNSSGTVDIEIGGAPGSGSNDQIVVTGTASFDGTIRVSLKNGFVPRVGQQFIAVNATNGRSGTFAAIIPPSGANAPCNNVTFVMVYSSTAAIVLVRPPLGCTALGDLNSDGGCNAPDVPLLISALMGGAYNACADMNGDCKNDGDDIQFFANCAM